MVGDTAVRLEVGETMIDTPQTREPHTEYREQYLSICDLVL